MFNPMKCNDHAELLGSPDYVLQRKYDGTRCIVRKKGDKITMIGRSEKSNYAPMYPEIVKEIYHLEDGMYDSELVFFDKNTGKDVFLTALAKPETKKNYNVALIFFDIMHNGDKNVMDYPLESRLAMLNSIFEKCEDKYNIGYLWNIDTYYDNTQHKYIYDRIIADGGEGVVLKRKGSLYVEDSRRDWVKVKKETTVDCIVVGMTKGKGARAPYFGALILAQYNDKGVLQHVCNCSGFDVETMKWLKNRILNTMMMEKDPDFKIKDVIKYVVPNLVIEVKCFDKTEDGSLRFPSFVRIRNDKPPNECKINQ